MKKFLINLVFSVVIFITSYYLIKVLYVFVGVFGFISGVAFATPNYGKSTQDLFDIRTGISAFLSFCFLLFRLINKK